jgi:uncharacterized membrane protein YbjE (DUF340 family)
MIKYIIPALILEAQVILTTFSGTSFPTLISDQLFTFTLIIMLFVLGFSFGRDKETMAKMRKTGLRIAGFLLGINVAGIMAVSSGFGWYTLSGPLLGQILGPAWGTLGFTTNFFRELLTIITIPLMVKLDKHAPVASGGGITMDTTLPLIVRYCGKDMLVTAFSNGIVPSLMAPFIIISISPL